MATSMSKSTTGAKTAGSSKQYLKKGGKVLGKAQNGMSKLKPDPTRPGLLYNPNNPNWKPASDSTTVAKKKKGGMIKSKKK